MSAQVIHEAESTRQHARYKIPAKLMIGEQSFDIEDWSVSGLSVRLPDKLTQSPHIKARMVFNFGEINTALDLELELIHRGNDKTGSGYRFVHLKQSQIAVLHHVINAYLSGDIVDAGELIEIVKRDAFSVQDKDKKITQISGEPNRLLFRFRQIIGAFALLIVLVSLISLIVYSLYNRLFIIKSVAASVNAHVIVVRSPRASYFEALPVIKKNAEIKPGELLATLQLINGGAANIESPCHCRIIKEHLLYKQFVKEGEPLLTLLPINNENLFIEAKFSYKDVSKLALNQLTEIKLMNGQQITGSVSKIQSSESVERKHTTPLKTIPSNPVSYVNVFITPTKKISINLLGSAAIVSIDSFTYKDK